MALAATLVVAELTFLHDSGQLYAPLYLGIAMFVSIYFNRRQAALQVLIIVAIWGVALGRTHPPADAAQMWILGAGTLITVAVTIRRPTETGSFGPPRVRRASARFSTRSSSMRPPASGSSITIFGTFASTSRRDHGTRTR